MKPLRPFTSLVASMVALLGLVATGCYSPRLDECKVLCATPTTACNADMMSCPPDSSRCPPDMTCGSDNFCHPPNSTTNCLLNDAAMVVGDAATIQDLSIAATADIAGCSAQYCNATTGNCRYGSGCLCTSPFGSFVTCQTTGCPADAGCIDCPTSVCSVFCQFGTGCTCTGASCSLTGCTIGSGCI